MLVDIESKPATTQGLVMNELSVGGGGAASVAHSFINSKAIPHE